MVFQNDDFIIVDKTIAASFHSEDGQPGLFEQVKTEHAIDTLFPVHRLDKLTTGLMIFAKSAACAGDFGQLFEAKEVEKYYLAISACKPKKKQGWIKGDMIKARRGAYKLLRSKENPAITQVDSHSLGDGLRLFLVKPFSGKTHQIRVALKSIGAPILGDVLYGGGDCDRGYLHAYALRFKLRGEFFEFISVPRIGEHFTTPQCGSVLANQWAEPWLNFKRK